MYDCDGNGWIDLQEMTRLVGSIYKMLDNHHLVQHVRSSVAFAFNVLRVLNYFKGTANERAKEIFEKMDVDSDGRVTREEFMKCCMDDSNMLNLLAPTTG